MTGLSPPAYWGCPLRLPPRNWPRRLFRNCAPVCFVVLLYEGPCQSSPLVAPTRVQTYIYKYVYTSPCPCQGCPRQGCPHQGCLRGFAPTRVASARVAPARVAPALSGCPARVAPARVARQDAPGLSPPFFIIFNLHFLSSNIPLRNSTNTEMAFFPFSISKDFYGKILIFDLYLLQIHFGFSSFSHPVNAVEACGLLTPLHIVPEWYFLCQYAMLKAVPNKNAGFIIFHPILLYEKSFIVILFYN